MNRFHENFNEMFYEYTDTNELRLAAYLLD